MSTFLPVMYVGNICDPLAVIVKANSVNNMFHICMNIDHVDIEHKFGVRAFHSNNPELNIYVAYPSAR